MYTMFVSSMSCRSTITHCQLDILPAFTYVLPLQTLTTRLGHRCFKLQSIQLRLIPGQYCYAFAFLSDILVKLPQIYFLTAQGCTGQHRKIHDNMPIRYMPFKQWVPTVLCMIWSACGWATCTYLNDFGSCASAECDNSVESRLVLIDQQMVNRHTQFLCAGLVNVLSPPITQVSFDCMCILMG